MAYFLGLRAAAAACLVWASFAGDAHSPVEITWPDDQYPARTHREHNFCDVNYGNQSRKLIHALSGRQVSVAVNLRPHGQDIFNFASYDPSTRLLTGFLVDVMDELARRGDFTWRDSFAVINRTSEQLPFPILQWSAENYDILVDWRTLSPDIDAIGVTPLMPFMDTSYNLLVKPELVAPGLLEQVFSYFRPFAFDTWLAFLVAWLTTAWAYWKFETGHDDFQTESSQNLPFIHSAYLSALMITGAGGVAPATYAGKFMTLMFSALVVLIVAAYTANLASLLVVTARITLPIQSLDQASASNVEVCTSYPESFGLFEDYTGSWRVMDELVDIYKSVVSGSCKVAMVRSFMWSVAKHSEVTNPGCSLYMLPEASKPARSGFVVRIDKPGYTTCIDRAAQVFNLILLEMDLDGFFQRLRRRHTHAAHPIKCPPGFPTAPATDSSSLTLESAGGMFITYAVCMLIALGLFRMERRCGQRDSSITDESDSASDHKLV
eukprot:CAMPEP_0170264220 /NCGR_PEP_ID=MMETSP0116_2-20130129/32003_1 /TAXON_ID=400756 /ORGANISM="Durinskia baltica, Strain CSIRO CS-38" /LENGTH=492 /DNA_ID=CAMNT_0010515309 /DNA_START=101 /DNA_END=1579 /DNA_ORIENTATION=-